MKTQNCKLELSTGPALPRASCKPLVRGTLKGMPDLDLSVSAILLMKVGFHTQESLRDIVDRKLKEQETAGVTFWGYGGTLCHPIKAVRPFAESCKLMNLSVAVAMPTTPSKFKGQPSKATEYSTNGVDWDPLPEGILVTASRYALVMTHLRPSTARLNLMQYEVAIGPSRGRPMSDYVKYRVDKALGIFSDQKHKSQEHFVDLSYTAELVAPYAVLLR